MKGKSFLVGKPVIQNINYSELRSAVKNLTDDPEIQKSIVEKFRDEINKELVEKVSFRLIRPVPDCSEQDSFVERFNKAGRIYGFESVNEAEFILFNPGIFKKLFHQRKLQIGFLDGALFKKRQSDGENNFYPIIKRELLRSFLSKRKRELTFFTDAVFLRKDTFICVKEVKNSTSFIKEQNYLRKRMRNRIPVSLHY